MRLSTSKLNQIFSSLKEEENGVSKQVDYEPVGYVTNKVWKLVIYHKRLWLGQT
jgi:hypothetical protein